MNKYLAKLQKLEGAVTSSHDPHSYVIQSPSPSVNFCFGNGWGLPEGFTLVLYGPPKGGKTLLVSAMIGQLHADDPDALVVKYDTEGREEAQMTPRNKAIWGIDPERYLAFSVNRPSLIFDCIEKEVGAMCDDGAKVKLVIIDSVSGILGRRAEGAESVDVQQIGDQAATIQDGLKRILMVQRKHRFALILTAQVRAEMDPLEIRRGNKVKMSGAFALKHHSEYFMYCEPNSTKEGRTDISGEEFRDEDLKDLSGNGEKTGHKIRVTMKDSSLGPKGRCGEFTLDYNKGIINVHEEAFRLGVARGIIERPNNMSYCFKDKKWVGMKGAVEAIKQDAVLQREILRAIKEKDQAGLILDDPANLIPSIDD